MATETYSHYALDNAAPVERERLLAIERSFNPATLAHLERLGATGGAAVLEVGAGAGGLLPALAQRLGPSGRILATDVDPRLLTALPEAHPTIEVLRHDVIAEELPAGRFDVVHARLLLAHLPDRARIVDRLVAALRPGGWLLVEDFDWGSYGPALPLPAAEKVIAAGTSVLESAGFDPYLGRKLPGLLRDAGLEDVDAEGRSLTLRGASSAIEPMYRHTFALFEPRLRELGLITEEDAAGFRARFDDPAYDLLTQTMVSAWGRRGA